VLAVMAAALWLAARHQRRAAAHLPSVTTRGG